MKKYEIETPVLIEGKILVLRRNNLIVPSQNKPYEDVEYTDIARSFEPVTQASVVMFIDEFGNTKLLKNRYGNGGIVIDREQYKKTNV